MLGNNIIARIIEHCGLMTDLGLMLIFRNYFQRCYNYQYFFVPLHPLSDYSVFCKATFNGIGSVAQSD